MENLQAIAEGARTITTWGTLPGWIMAISSSGILALLVRAWLGSRKLRIEENVDDRAGYGDVIRTLREEVARLTQNEVRCEERLTKLEAERIESRALREAERARHEAEQALMRHRANNAGQCLDALLLLLETAPDKVAEAVGRIKDMRARQREEEAIEKAAIHAATITAAAPAHP